MSIASEISRLNTAKTDIKTALEGKGISVSSGRKIDGYAELIESIVPDTRLVVKYNVTSTSDSTTICSDVGSFSAIEIDGVAQPSVVDSYTFNTTGIHIVRFTLADPTSIGQYAFYSCTDLTSITIPNSVTSIGDGAFIQCSGLTSITIPNSVTSIGQYAFYSCTGLTSITIGNSVTSIGSRVFTSCNSLSSIISNATTAPTTVSNTFLNVGTGGTLIVPSGSTGYDTWMNDPNLYEWTKVEQ